MNGSILIKEKIILFLFLIIYIGSVGSDPILGDSLVFTVIASQGFDLETNATNHFLYINLLALSHKILPFVNPHYLFVSISIFCSIVTLYFLRRLLILFAVKENILNFLVIIFGFSFTFWRVSVITEVYSFYMMFSTLFLYKVFSYVKNKKSMDFYYSAILFGVMFLIHIQTILLLPFYFYFLYDNFRNQKTNITIGLLLPALIFSFLVIPVIQGKYNFMAIFTDNKWETGFFEFEIKTFIKALARNLAFLIYNLIFLLFFIFKGFKNVGYKKYILFALLPYFYFVLKHDVSDSYVFHLIPYVFLLIIIGKGLGELQFAKNNILVLILPICYFFSFKTIEHTRLGKIINEEKRFKGGVRYIFFPPLNGNPKIEKFIEVYDNNLLRDKESFERQYKFAIEWQQISMRYSY